ncbi:UDP-N-acetylmuramoyl-L-alanyl-D-glutamate--2,6-diaminopimelate ligase [Acinetobacter nectaris]|uniref:UDP-N-acetylmuramoyl-L-alanyl-D-glutamate--2, 6-diaminopimelate ligase n=1 Tax=Acinetobacter nectaris TaxID=1219382 RepID=UPI001F0319EB|nr:UDP-N-acetylmuramoyl-L-alanyl-D-glutamate--2,6-diaminopimelate ligase [Acinetobacter nectaris]MCF9045631.1 UDP-N-acetylmuramoyl-L-alanyl-D-glutamate--2,6-diaminopimelate ligase [Acinetobacter nectaris]
MSITLQEIYPVEIQASWVNQPFEGFCLDSRYIRSGQIFIALNSYSQPEKTLDFAQAALEQGALGVISEQVLNIENNIVCSDVRHLMGAWQKQYLESKKSVETARILAVTGTNGKTTIARLMAELLTLQHKRCAVMGTAGNGILPHLVASSHTTLDALSLQNELYHYAEQEAQFVALEASSHGLVQGRLSGSNIEVAVYSNLSRDHLDFHGTLDVYAAAKAQLFQFQTLKTAVINLDDAYASVMQEAAKNNPSQPRILTYSMKDHTADFYVSEISFSLDGAEFTLHTADDVYRVKSPLLGHFNIENLVASLIAAATLGEPLQDLIEQCSLLEGAPGRMQVIRDDERIFVVDYAHTPDALIQVLGSLKRHVNHQLWAIFGCGGDRDRGKRILMTQAAINGADLVVLTSDNPRTEDPTQIFADMKQGLTLSEVLKEIDDRREAIKYAVKHAQAGDIVVIAGKGHENYQEVNGVRHWFDDVVEVKSAIQAQHTQPNAYLAGDHH